MQQQLLVTTEIGEVRLSVTDANHVHVHSTSYLTVKRREITASVHLYLTDGTWTTKGDDLHRPYLTHRDYTKGAVEAPTVRAAIVAALVEIANEHVTPLMRARAEVEHLDQRAERAAAELTQAEEAVRKCAQEHYLAINALAVAQAALDAEEKTLAYLVEVN